VVDLTKPCVKCGEVDRNAQGRCRPCQRKYETKYRKSKEGREKLNTRQRRRRQSEKVREAKKASDRRYRQSEKVREAKKASDRKRFLDLTTPCKECGVVGRYQNGKCKACVAIHQKTNQSLARRHKARSKYKKLNFQFNLQNQQKAIEQRQQISTQPNDKN